MESYIEIISQYLGTKPNLQIEAVEPNVHKWYEYQYQDFKYVISINLGEKTVNISIDEEQAFQQKSLFETYNYWESISITTEPNCYGEQEILNFHSSTLGYPNHIILKLVKWPNGKISVWQNSPPTKKI